MQNFQITYGIGSGYNISEQEIIEASDINDAVMIAYRCAAELFESYGIFEDQNRDYDYNSEDADADYEEEMNRWIDYTAVAV